MKIKNRFTDAVIFEGDYSAIADCVRAAYAGGADLRNADLRSADLTSANLTSADLYGADLTSAYYPNSTVPVGWTRDATGYLSRTP